MADATAPLSPLERLFNGPLRPGLLCWIGLRPARREALVAVEAAALDPEEGLCGDHARGRLRQVTLIQAEHLAAIAAYQGLERVAPETLRRNLVVAGVNLLALKDRQFRIGDTVVLEATGPCHPVLAHGGGTRPRRLQRRCAGMAGSRRASSPAARSAAAMQSRGCHDKSSYDFTNRGLNCSRYGSSTLPGRDPRPHRRHPP